SANVLGPIPMATLVGVLAQPFPLPMPLIDAHVAPADPAPDSAVMASPDATAPSRIPPASLWVEISRRMAATLPADCCRYAQRYLLAARGGRDQQNCHQRRQ